MKRPGARQASAALALPLPDPQRTGRLPLILAAARQLADIYRERVPVFAVVPGPCGLPALVLGMDAWLETLLFDEAAARTLLDHTGTFFVAWANALLAAGVNGLVVAEGMASVEVVPRGLFAERLLPHLRATFERVRGPLVFHHAGGRIQHILDLLPGVAGLVGGVVSSKDDLAEARRRIGPDLLLLGNLDNLSFPAASADEIRERSLACLQAAAPAGRYILANSAADIPLTTPPENVRAMVAASEAYAAGGGSRS